MRLMNCVLGLFLTSSCVTSYAMNPPKWDIVSNESELTFTATQNEAPVTGGFKKFSGTILVDPADYKTGSIDIVVDMSSVTASYADLKTTLVAPDWFNVALFPKAEFKATQFNKTGENSYDAIGTLTIRDKSAPVTLHFTANITNNNHAVVTGETTIKRNAFGVGQGEWSSTKEIKDDVVVHFKVVANR